MEDLIELVRVLSKNKIKQIDLIHPSFSIKGRDSRETKLYEKIISGEIQTEEEGQLFFYGDSPRRGQYFKRLKTRLQEKLFNSLFFIDFNQPHFTDIQRAFYKCHKNYAIIKILIGRQSKSASIDLAKKTLRYALKFEFTELVINLSRILRLHYGTISGDFKESQKYNQLLAEAKETLTSELIAEEYYTDIAANFVNSRSSKFEIEERAKSYEEHLRKLLEKSNSYNFILHSYYVFVLRYQIINDYERTLEVCQEAINAFKKKAHISTQSALLIFHFNMLTCYRQLRKYQEGEATALICLEYSVKGSYNWYAIQETYLLLAVQSGQYLKAWNVLQETITSKNFSKQLGRVAEIWNIYKAYLLFLVLIEEIPGEEKKRFRIGKFLNEVPTFSKDKRGINIPIIIIQILFDLLYRNYGNVIDRVEALNMYCHRYLRKDDTFRSNCFIKMLLQLPPAQFNKVAAQRKAAKFHEKLVEMPIEKARQGSEIEIIPYEELWKFTLQLLDKKFH